uniref:TNF receptor superfamily member 11a n=1 Tax=Nothoprocta perdicaria TaxID=30464 RepID=A0A8C6ZJS8_NOTPE
SGVQGRRKRGALVLTSFLAFSPQLSRQVTPPCESERHYEHAGRCCGKCEPGKYMSAKCTGTSDSVCQPCGPNEYMDVWNEEDKCLLHKICDQGKALQEVHPGNSTFQRQCACTAGYHWSDDCDCCQRNTVCAPGFGVKHPVQQDKDTLCAPCPTGYFSKVASATEGCKSWTKILYVLIVILFFVALIGIVVFIIYYKNKGKKLTGTLQLMVFLNEPPRDVFVDTGVTNAAAPHISEGMCLLAPDAYSPHGNTCCTSTHLLCMNSSPRTAPCGVAGNLQEFSVVSETGDDHFPPVPMEDEYTDKDLNTADYLSLLSQPDSKTVSTFSEPVEIGENDSLNQCFSGVGSTEDVSAAQGLNPSSKTDSPRAAVDKYLQKSCVQAPSCPKEADTKDTDGLRSQPYGAAADGAPSSPETGSHAQCTCGLHVLSAGQSTLASDRAVEDASSEGTDAKSQRTRSTSGTSSSTSDLPPASGNVTGNSNSTFISSGQVMNFKGDIIVVYVSQNSQEGAPAAGAAPESVGSPVQEENASRCETFAGTAPHYKEKCAEGHGAYAAASQPVQEEGRLGHCSEKVLN